MNPLQGMPPAQAMVLAVLLTLFGACAVAEIITRWPGQVKFWAMFVPACVIGLVLALPLLMLYGFWQLVDDIGQSLEDRQRRRLWRHWPADTEGHPDYFAGLKRLPDDLT